MRLAPILAQYLYLNKRLELPGLGTFLMETSATAEPENSRHSKSGANESIRFETDLNMKESPELIAFISSQTGKIKALASADLESHLELANQFLNIGKPFLFEGIGNMVRVRAGEYIFTPGAMLSDQKKETILRDNTTAYQERDIGDYDYKNIFYPKQVKATWKKPVAIILLVAGLGLAIWGGYTVYKRTSAKKDQSQSKKEVNPVIAPTDTFPAVKKDPTAITRNNSVALPGTYKFILENTDSARAYSRFNTLRTYQWNVQLEKADASNYKLFMMLQAAASDTVRLIDSLRRLTGRRVYVDK